MSNEIETLLQQGKQAVLDDDYATARKYLKQVVMRDPHNEQGWLWLSGALENEDRMQYCLQRVLQINPHNYHAAATLRDMGHNIELPPEPSDTSQPPPAAPTPAQTSPLSVATPQKASSEHQLRRRPDSMVEGSSVQELAVRHRRISWMYMFIWSIIWGLHGMLIRAQFAGPRPTLSDTLGGAAITVAIQMLAWWVFLALLDRAQRLHTLHHTSTYAAVSMALWPSGLAALGALLLGALTFGSDASTVAAGDVGRLVLTGASFLLLLRGLLRELTNNDLYARTARRSIGTAFLGFVIAWSLAGTLAWNVLG